MRLRPLTTPKLGLDRVNAFSDGVLAIVITLLVLTIEVPSDFDFASRGPWAFLGDLEKPLRAYAAGFLLVATYWIQHVFIFRFARYSTHTLLRLNILFLLPVTLVPLAVTIHGKYPTELFTIVVFAVTHMACFATLLLLWNYVAAHCREGAQPVDPGEVRRTRLRLLAAILVCALTVLVSRFSLRLATLLFLSVPLLFLTQYAAPREEDAARPG